MEKGRGLLGMISVVQKGKAAGTLMKEAENNVESRLRQKILKRRGFQASTRGQEINICRI